MENKGQSPHVTKTAQKNIRLQRNHSKAESLGFLLRARPPTLPPSLPFPPFPPLFLPPFLSLSPHMCYSTYLDIREQLSRVASLCSILFLGGFLLFLPLCFLFQAIVPPPILRSEARDYRCVLPHLAFVWYG